MPVEVLVIDDETTDRMAIRRALALQGGDFIVHEAGTGAEAAHLLKTRRFDCVFVDFLLPDTDGISLMKELYDAETDELPAPFVMLTGQGSRGVLADAMRSGAHDYIIKDNISADTLVMALTKAREVFDLRKGRREMEEMLHRAQKLDAVGQLTSGIAHDFNNLLTVILGNTRLLHRKLEAAPDGVFRDDFTRKIEAIETTARKGAELVRHLMVFTRERDLKQERANINGCVTAALDMLRRSLGEQVEIERKLAPDAWPVCIDAGQFEHALINIAVNARDAMPQGGRLTIETCNVTLDAGGGPQQNPAAAAGDYVLVSVADTGAGMPEAVRLRIFDPFFTTKAAGEGTGLGLSMVYGFVRQSGGHVSVESEEGQGAIFRLFFPRHGAAEQANAGRGEAIHAR